MKEMTLQKGSIVGVFLLGFLAILLLLVHGIAAADDSGQVGITNVSKPGTCLMKDQLGFIVEPEEDVDIFIIDTPSSEYPRDVVAVLRCQTSMVNVQGHAVNFSGDSTNSCRAYFAPTDPTITALTTSWSQTISASGNATLTCQFKRAHNLSDISVTD